MLVVCGRCETEYEFDDTLLSERGTTVRCTNCGYQFRVKAPRGFRSGLERWEVRKPSGERLTLGSLRELRKAIEEDRVHVDDELSRQGGPFRPLRSVAELEALFQRKRAGQPRLNQTLMGVGAPGASGELRTAKPATSTPLPGAPAGARRAVPAHTPARTPAPQKRSTPPGPMPILSAERAAAIRTGSSSAPPVTERIPHPTTQRSSSPPRRAERRDSDAPRHTPTGSAAMYESFSSEDRKSASYASVPPPADPPPPAVPRQPAGTWTSADAAPGRAAPAPAPVNFVSAPPSVVNPAASAVSPETFAQRSAPRSMPPAPLSVPPPPRKAGGLRWVVGFVVLGGLGLLAGTVGKDYLMRHVKPESEAAVADARVEAMLSQAAELFADGDLEGAKAEYDRASVLAEKEPRVLFGLARIAAVRADLEWLRQRLVAEEDAASKQRIGEQLTRRIAQLDKAVVALEAAPDEGSRALLQTDAARIAGNLAKARQTVETASFDVTDPHVAYVLAMLDVAEVTPAWATVIQRLQTALVSERALGRARAALVYAAAASGNATLARAQLQELGDDGRRHALFDDLSAFVERRAAAAPVEVGGEAIDLDDPSVAAAAPAVDPATGATPSVEWYLNEAAASRRSGDLVGARARYKRVLALKPGNVAALAGLGSIARMQGSYDEAKQYFDQVLEKSPGHAGALAGGADVRWLMGNREAAVVLYRKLSPNSVYYAEAQRRIAEFTGKSPVGSETPSAPEAPPAASSAPQTPKAETPAGTEPAAPKAAEQESPTPKQEGAEPAEPKPAEPKPAEPESQAPAEP